MLIGVATQAWTKSPAAVSGPMRAARSGRRRNRKQINHGQNARATMAQRHKHPSVPETHVLVTDAAGVRAVVDAIGSSGRFAFDAEFIGEDAYAAEICLIQAATPDAVYLIDPLTGVDLASFWSTVTDGSIETVVHAGLEDLTICYQHVGQAPRRVFDVQVAAGLVGLDYPMSLSRLARATLGVRLHKSQTLTDWRKRPLSAEQLDYAVQDVVYVLAIRDALGRKLGALDRHDWADEEFARFSDERLYQPRAELLVRRVKGAGTLDGRALAIAQEVAVERDRLAKEFNRPPRVLLKDHLVVAMARHGWAKPSELKSLRGMTLTGWPLQRICAAVQRGLDVPEGAVPEPSNKDEDTPWEGSLCRFLTAVLHDYCRCQDVSFQLMGSNRDVRAEVLAHTRGAETVGPGALGGGWRNRFAGKMIGDILSGTCSIRVRNGNKPQLEASD